MSQSRGSQNQQSTARGRLLLDQRTPAEYEHSLELKRSKRKKVGIISGSIISLIIVGAIVLLLFFFREIFKSSNGNNSNGNNGDDVWTIDNITLPSNDWKIEIFMQNRDNNNNNNPANYFWNPRVMHVSQYEDATIVYVGSARYRYSTVDPSFLYALVDRNSDGTTDEMFLIFEARGTAALTINEEKQLLYVDDNDGNVWLCQNVHEQVLNMDDPINNRLNGCEVWLEVPINTNDYHGSHDVHAMTINQETEELCISFGVSCNICDPDYPEGNIICFPEVNPSFEDGTVYAEGVRNSVGLQFHPITNNLWFTDNGRDYFGDNQPDDELNKVEDIGEHFGYPHCHTIGFGSPYLREAGETDNIVDDEFGLGNNSCANFSNFQPGIQPLGPHVAALGMRFMFNDDLPPPYHRSIIVTNHGSWNRNEMIGYRVMIVFLSGNDYNEIGSTGYGIFADGWLDTENQIEYGRPADVALLPDGSILVTDDGHSKIYRIWYDPE